MNDERYNSWDIFFKWFGLFAVLVAGLWTVHKYRQDRAAQLADERTREEQVRREDEVTRKKELNSYIFQHQATLYFDAARAAATLANSNDQKAKTAARERFDQLYWGELVVVEDRRVELAMIAFNRCLGAGNIECRQAPVTQFGTPNKQAGDPTVLRNLALDLAACTRSALKKDRDIVFGEVQPAETTCPYD